jgi:hypothetical protein
VRWSDHLVKVSCANCRFTHARIRPFFSGCAMRVEDTLAQLTSGQITIDCIPYITVVENDGNFYSLNNRRLYVLKSLRQLGLLPNNEITVRVKQPLDREKTKYTPEHCALTAVVMNEHSAASVKESEECPQDCIAAVDDDEGSKTRPGKTKSNLSTAIPKQILKELPGLNKQVETGKSKKAKETVDKWLQSGSVSQEQYAWIKLEIGL